jgi:YhcN/YlaJ family sporulation lipoprotein
MRYFIGIVIVLSLVTGCNNQADNGTSSSPQNKDQQVRVNQTAPQQQENLNTEDVTERLENLAKSVPQVEDATCVVIGNTAVVGIDVKGNLDRSRVGTLKYTVAEALKKDPHGVNAIITADIDIGSRLSEIRKDIRNGRPVSGFAEEMADIIGRIMPQIPGDIGPRDNQQNVPQDRQQIKNKSL